ncbi:MAG TPA: CinA family protein [Demequina sp.]|nr:CinA family protein [Demequina sp.]
MLRLSAVRNDAALEHGRRPWYVNDRGARRQLGADVAVATTGVAGPDAHGGKPPGTVIVAVVGPQGERVVSLLLDGDRDAVRQGAVAAALSHLEKTLSRLPHS